MFEKPDIIDKFFVLLNRITNKIWTNTEHILDFTVVKYILGGILWGGIILTVIGDKFDFETIYFVGIILLSIVMIIVSFFFIPIVIYLFFMAPMLSLSSYLRDKEVPKGKARIIALLSYIGGVIALLYITRLVFTIFSST